MRQREAVQAAVKNPQGRGCESISVPVAVSR